MIAAPVAEAIVPVLVMLTSFALVLKIASPVPSCTRSLRMVMLLSSAPSKMIFMPDTTWLAPLSKT